MPPVDYNFKRGVDTPVWEWLAPFPAGISYHGTSNCYDGKRYIYWVVQRGSAATSASTSELWRYCTWTDSWHFLATLTSGNRGMDVEYDPVRNCLYIIIGAATTAWQAFNLNTTAIVVANVTLQPFVITTMTPVLPVAADYGASFIFPNDLDVEEIWSGTVATGSTSTVVVDSDTSSASAFQTGMIGLQVRYTSGALSGQTRTVVSVQNANQLTVSPAFTAAPAAGDAYSIEMQSDTATAGTTTTLTDSKQAWPVNRFANHDVIIVSGTGAGQRRRIASNTATALTLAAAVTGNTGTGPFSPAPAADSVYRIVPSDDFLYYVPGVNSNTFHKIDLSQTTGVAWAAQAVPPGASGSGGNTMYPGNMAPGSILAFRGNATNNFYQYDIGTNTWSTLTIYGLANTITTGGAAGMVAGKRRILLHQEATTRLLVANLATSTIEAFGTIPYANPAAYDGKRLRHVKTEDDVRFLYVLRAGGQEFFRVALEWV